MPQLADVPIGTVVDVLRPTFHSLDLRAIVVDLGQDKPQWRLVAGICSASRASPEEVEALHQDLLKQSPPPKTDRFRILFQVRPVDHMATFLDEIDAGILTAGDLTVNLGDPTSAVRPWKPIRDQCMRGNTYSQRNPEGGLFPIYGYSLRMPTPPDTVSLLAQAVDDSYALGLAAWSDLNLWLRGMQYLRPLDGAPAAPGLELCFPIYAALRDTPTIDDEGDRFKITAVAHGALQPELYAQGSIRPDSSSTTPRASTPLEIPSAKKLDDLNEFSLTMPFDPRRIRERDAVQIDLFHRTLGQLRNYPATTNYSYIKDTMGDLLVRALLLFEGGKNLARYLTDRRSQKQADLSPFEASVVWLLSLLGLRCVPLLIYRKGEEVREEDTIAGSADILAADAQQKQDPFERKLGLLLIDCTRSVPDNSKIDGLRNTALFLSKQLKHPVHAAIVTPTDLVALSQESARYGVAFLDCHQIAKLWDLIQRGHTEGARAQFIDWIHDVPEINKA